MATLTVSDDWFLGFFEGEGSFTYTTSIEKGNVKRVTPILSLSIQGDDDLAEAVANKIGGTRHLVSPKSVYPSGKPYSPCWRIRVCTKSGLGRAVEFFDAHKPVGKKAADYEIWRRMCVAYRDLGGGTWKLEELAKELSSDGRTKHGWAREQCESFT